LDKQAVVFQVQDRQQFTLANRLSTTPNMEIGESRTLKISKKGNAYPSKNFKSSHGGSGREENVVVTWVWHGRRLERRHCSRRRRSTGCWRPRRDGARHTGSLPISSLFTFVECRGTASQSGGPTNGGGRPTRTEARRGGAGTSCSGERAGGRLENERTLTQRSESQVQRI